MTPHVQTGVRGRSVLWLLIFLLASACPAAAGDQGLVVEQRTLPNGLRVWVSPVDRAKTVEVRLAVLGGQVDALPQPRQTAHLLEHLLLQSRPGGSALELQEELRKRNSQLNGESWDLATIYKASGPPDELSFLLSTLGQLVFENSLDGKDVAGESKVVVDEFGGVPSWADKLGARVVGTSLWHRLCREVFAGSPLWNHPDFPALTVPEITWAGMEQYYRRYYSPANSFLIVVGPVDAAEALHLAERACGGIPAGSTPVRSLEEPERPGHLVEVHHRGWYVFGRRGAVSCGARLDHCCDRQLYGYMVLRNFIRERTYDELRLKQHLTYGVSTDTPSAGDYGLMTSEVVVDANLVYQVAQQLKTLYLAVGREGLSAEQFERLRRDVRVSHGMTLDQANGRANWLAFFAVGPRGRGGDPFDPMVVIDSLTLAEVNELAKEAFQANNMFVGTELPLLNVWQSTLALAAMVVGFVGLVALVVRQWRRRKKARAGTAQV
jgi:zinc protease